MNCEFGTRRSRTYRFIPEPAPLSLRNIMVSSSFSDTE